jgi:hypothetical protein
MMVGIILVRTSNLFADKEAGEENDEGSTSLALGILFVVLKVLMGVSKDVTQEIFMQESNFSATLLVEMEGFYGLCMAIPLYVAVSPTLGYDPKESFQGIGESGLCIGYICGCLLSALWLASTPSWGQLSRCA